MNIENEYNKWVSIEKNGLGNNELYQFTKSELIDFGKHLVNRTNNIHDVSDCKKLNIHKCLNDLEKVIEINTGVLDFIDRGSLRYQLKKAIDKMVCCC